MSPFNISNSTQLHAQSIDNSNVNNNVGNTHSNALQGTLHLKNCTLQAKITVNEQTTSPSLKNTLEKLRELGQHAGPSIKQIIQGAKIQINIAPTHGHKFQVAKSPFKGLTILLTNHQNKLSRN